MKLYAISILVVAAAAAACDKPATDTTTTTSGTTVVAPDNTKVNARDRTGSVTPMDQENNAADLSTPQTIRKAVMADDALSSDAKNVKIITANGVITLRGPVKNESEKQNIEAKASAAAGTNHVDDQLELETSP